MSSKLQNTISIEVPSWLSFEYEYAPNDESRPARIHLTGEVAALKALLEEALEVLS